MSFMLDGRNVSVVQDHSSSHSLIAMLFVSLDRSRDGVFQAFVTLLKGDVRLSTQFLFTVRDTLPRFHLGFGLGLHRQLPFLVELSL